MTRAEQMDLDALAKAVSVGTDGRYSPSAYPLLQPAADVLATLAWQPTMTCLMCPRLMARHTCSCPHHQARKRLVKFGVWPEGK